MGLNDQVAAEIAQISYKNGFEKEIKIESVSGNISIWKIIEAIEDKDTGLHGYVLQNPNSDEIVISFEGTDPPGSGDISEFSKDVDEDLSGIVLGDSNYTKKEYGTTKYLGTPSQDARLASGQAYINQRNQTITYTNKNQFTEADPVVNKYIKKYGPNKITFVGHSLGGGLAQYFAVKYDSNAITFAAADVFGLLTNKKQKMAINGEFKDNIISYTFPDDVVGNIFSKAIGSVYYMDNPNEIDGLKDLTNHGIRNYVDSKMFDEEGYFIPNILYDANLYSSLNSSPLELKNNGFRNFNILIQSSIMGEYVKEMNESIEQITNTRKSLIDFYEYYSTTMTSLKNKYLNEVGCASQYSHLNSSHVEEVFQDLTRETVDGVPMLFDIEHYGEILKMLHLSIADTEEIAFHMEKMSKDFVESDKTLAQWLQLK